MAIKEINNTLATSPVRAVGKSQDGDIPQTTQAIKRNTTSTKSPPSSVVKGAANSIENSADLRAQGEFEKADALLQIGQTYLSQLMSLKQWASEFAFDVEKYNESIREWEQNYELDVAQLLGYYRGSPTLAMQQFQFNQTKAAADAANSARSGGGGDSYATQAAKLAAAETAAGQVGRAIGYLDAVSKTAGANAAAQSQINSVINNLNNILK